MRLKDRVAIITGGSRGIGRAGAIALAREGAKVVIASRGKDKADEAVNLIKANGGEAIFIQADIGNPEQVQSMVRRTLEQYKKVDILVNNAGITDDAFFEKMSRRQWERVVNVNLNGTFYCTREVVPHMIENRYGRIINTSSVSGKKGAIAQSNYAATKAAIIGLTLSLAQELGPKGITVNAVSPGFIHTDMTVRIPEKIRLKALGKIPVGKFGLPEDIANTYVFLAGDEGSYYNGAVLDIDGGISV